MSDKGGETFVGFVELNERAWGTNSYPGRPTLHEILTSKIVAFWRTDQKRDHAYRVTLHTTLRDINNYASAIVLHSNTRTPERRLMRLYVDQRRVVIRGVKLILEFNGEPPLT